MQDNSSGDAPQRRMLRRETAVELPITPSKSASVAGTSADIDSAAGVSGSCSVAADVANLNERIERSSPLLSRNLSGDPSYGRTSASGQNYLIPSTSEPSQKSRFKKSIESLPKNSSSETEYSLQPYRVIKQSSNETNTSLTGSFNIDQSFCAHELSIDTNETSAHYTMVIENIDGGSSPDATSLNKSDSITEPQQPLKQQQPSSLTSTSKIARQQSDVGQSRLLRKQFSVDHSSKVESGGDQNICGKTILASNLKLPIISTIPATPTKTLSAIVSSSTSTDESKDDRDIPTISTNIVQDEIIKLSSNINKNDEMEENSTDPPLNETMC